MISASLNTLAYNFGTNGSYVLGILLAWGCSTVAKLLALLILYIFGRVFTDNEYCISFFKIHCNETKKLINLLNDPDECGMKIMLLSSIPDWPAAFYSGLVEVPLEHILEAIFPGVF